MMLISTMLLHNGFDLVAFTDANYLLIENLVEESKQEGFKLVQRTIDDWNSGANRFSQTGEGLWGLVSGTELIGIGGLNIDPYVANAGIGRVRHLYIRRAYRRKGCATLLMNDHWAGTASFSPASPVYDQSGRCSILRAARVCALTRI